MRHPIHLIARGPQARVIFHTMAAWAWFVAMFIVPFVPDFRANWGTLAVLEVSLYANFATEFGSIDAARASMQTGGNKEANE